MHTFHTSVAAHSQNYINDYDEMDDGLVSYNDNDMDMDDGLTPSDEFPHYNDGDVIIILSASRRFQLHSGVLRRNSPILARMLSEENAAQLTRKAIKDGVVIRYCLELTEIPLPGAGGTGHFVTLPVDDRGRFVNTSRLLPDIDNGRLPRELFLHYENLFRAYYNLDFEMHDEHIAAILRQAMGLVEVAEQLGSVRAVSRPIDIALISQGQVLLRSISSNAIAWVGLAQRLKSDFIFREAIVHLVGQWMKTDKQSKDQLGHDIATLCNAKHAELDQMKRAIEIRICGHYPGSLQRSQESSDIGRSAYSNDVFSWMAVGLFRHWMGQEICNDKNHHAEDGGYAFYKQISEGGQAYLDRTKVAGFHQYFAMSQKGQAVFENHLNVIKESVKPFVKALFENNSQLDIEKYRVPYLTCTKVEKKDMPWYRKKLVAPTAKMVRSSDADDYDNYDNYEDGV